ncbi:MAG: GNAT family N-acetyltransferase [Desulfobacteraceae bacterium]|nr:MAG: GNAT family N-acetyltransferase [Desulfobacteraceae bacterium]
MFAEMPNLQSPQTKKTKRISSAVSTVIKDHVLWLKYFRPKIRFQFDYGNYVVKTAENGEELKKILKLRYDVFFKEYREIEKHLQIDMDRFDLFADHLAVFKKDTGDCIATYRLIATLFAKKFYSQTEFDISAILKLPGAKLELGRACVDRKHRNSGMMLLLWKGLSEYVRLSDARYLFGCSSIKTMDIREIADLYVYLKTQYPVPGAFRVRPLKKFRIKEFSDEKYLTETSVKKPEQDIKRMIPALMMLYLRVGAHICGEPALDRKFHCADFFTLLDTSKMSKKAERKYNL